MRKVVVLNKETKELEAGYDSLTECAEKLGVTPQTIFKAVNHKCKSVKGKVVLYAEEYLLLRKPRR